MFSMSSRKKMFRFGIKDDIGLLTDVVAINPFNGDSMTSWSTIPENFMDQHPDIAIDGRRCRERTHLMLSYFRASDREKLYKSGSEEEYSKKEQLLTELDQLQSESSTVTASNKRSDKKDEEKKAAIVRKKAMENMKSADDGDVDVEVCQTKVKRRKQDMLSYLKEKNENEKQLEKEKLEIERERLAMDRKRQDMEIEKFRLEKEERTKMLELLSVLISNKK